MDTLLSSQHHPAIVQGTTCFCNPTYVDSPKESLATGNCAILTRNVELLCEAALRCPSPSLCKHGLIDCKSGRSITHFSNSQTQIS